MKCPGQDTRHWRPGDIFDWPCPACGTPVEFFKDDTTRRCSSCGYRIRNPRLDLGCAAWCPHGARCLAGLGADGSEAEAGEDADPETDSATALAPTG